MRILRLLFMCSIFIASRSNAQQSVRINFLTADTSTIISKHIYGHFAEHLGRCIYDGFYRNGSIRMDIVAALKKLKVPNLRWPGGCFADQYHWRDGIGAPDKRPVTINTTWGMVKEDNSFGTHEFLQLCQLIGCDPYIAGNVGTGTPQEMKEWIEYLNLSEGSTLAELRKTNGHEQPYKVAWWGVGNESWGCGGNMQPEYYAGQYKQFAAFCPDYSGTKLKKIISGANGDDYHWTEVMMKNISLNDAWGLSLHYYTLPTGKWNAKGSATAFSESDYIHTLKAAMKMETIISRNEMIMDKYDPEKRMALLVDEWGVWTDAEPGTPGYALYQQNSLRDALMAATTLNIFNNHAERVRGANLAQAVNVLQALVLTKGEQMLLTPTYHVFDLYTVHQDSKLILLQFLSPKYINGSDTINAINASASKDDKGRLHISIVNLDPNQTIAIMLPVPAKTVSGQILTAEKFTDINTFERPDKVAIKPFKDYARQKEGITLKLPAKSLVVLETE